MHLVAHPLPPPLRFPLKKIGQPLSLISLETSVIPRGNWKEWLCKISGDGVWKGGKQGALWSI